MKHRKGTPCYISTIFFLISFTVNGQQISNNQSVGENIGGIFFSKTVISKIMNGAIVSKSNVSSKPSNKKFGLQILKFEITGLHRRGCRFALRKLSRYEDFEKYISFVKKSSYENERINLRLHSSVLPVKMVLNFKIPRITRPGSYPFTFDRGFLKGLVGTINVLNFKDRCLFYTRADWTGEDTGFPNLVLEFFSSTLSSMSMRTLFRISN